MIKPWRKLSEKTHKFGFRSIITKTFEDQNGLVEDWDTFGGKDFGMIFAMTQNKKILVAEQYRVGPEQIIYQLPAGEQDSKSQSIEDVMSRELLEETGFQGDVEYVGKFSLGGYDNHFGHLGIVKNAKKVADAKLDYNEFIKIHEMTVSEVKQLLKERKFIDSGLVYYGLDYLGLM